ncbi:bifunctional oligoribonuclease/PAP phosphatase NrnA [Desulfococcus sp.]|uniref:DHH family phosphoesterase n=1 Tax=Desulfococcus sp. TaxID=2025834 RepID=UPI003593B1F3
MLHDFPDPDAISTALSHQVCCDRFDIETDIVYCGRISHQENVALVRLLGIELLRYEETLDLAQYQGAVFLDTQGATAVGLVKALADKKIPKLIVVDHHEPQGDLDAEFKDIRRNIGSTASIYTEYLQNGLLEMDNAVAEHVKVYHSIDTRHYHGHPRIRLCEAGGFSGGGISEPLQGCRIDLLVKGFALY